MEPFLTEFRIYFAHEQSQQCEMLKKNVYKTIISDWQFHTEQMSRKLYSVCHTIQFLFKKVSAINFQRLMVQDFNIFEKGYAKPLRSQIDLEKVGNANKTVCCSITTLNTHNIIKISSSYSSVYWAHCLYDYTQFR